MMLREVEFSLLAFGVFSVPLQSIWKHVTSGEAVDNADQLLISHASSWFMERNLGFISLILLALFYCILVYLYLLHIKKSVFKINHEFCWVLRPGADAGLWSVVLVPAALVSGWVLHAPAGHLFVTAVIISVGLLGTSLFLLTWISMYDSKNEQRFSAIRNIWCLLPTLVCGIALHQMIEMDLVKAYILSGLSQIVFIRIVMLLPTLCQGNFTIGEAFLIAQGVTVFISTSCLSLAANILETLNIVDTSNKPWTTVSDSTQFVQSVLLGAATVIILLYYIPILRNAVLFYFFCVSSGATVAYFSSSVLMKTEPVTWLLYFVLSSHTRLILISWWTLLTITAVGFVIAVSFFQSVWHVGEKLKQNKTIIRKFFHGIVIFVFTPGILFDTELLFVATGIALGVFLVAECIRVLQIPPFGWAIKKSFSIFLDDKDSGILVLTHIYLLIGCSLPLWIFPLGLEKSEFHISLLSGILSLGVGDTVASIVGTYFGRHKLPGTKKSIEGTLSATVIQMLTTFIWCLWDPKLTNYFYLALSSVLSCFMEAVTLQVDNLVLPLFLYILFIGIS